MAPIVLGRETCGDFGAATRHEWLVTNGIGGFGCGTVSGAASRRYHGLLVAALRPPLGRTVTLVKADAVAVYRDQRLELGSNQYADGTVHPRGHLHIESFALHGGVPTWTFAVADARLECRVFMAHGRNTSHVLYTLARAARPLRLELAPLVAWRDYHWHQHGPRPFEVTALGQGCDVVVDGGRLRLRGEGGRFETEPDWHWNLLHAAERERGLDDHEDLFVPGRFVFTLSPGESVCLVASTEDAEPAPSAEALAALRAREGELLARLPADAPPLLRRLALAADQFLVTRGGDAEPGATVIAGYPWFTDWGRDTMIALPGLTLATGRPELAREVLATFARHVQRGLLPNRFPDGEQPPEFNTVDATLWFFQAVHEYLAATGDTTLATTLHPVLADILSWHERGTSFGIGVDPGDGLLRAGEPGVQLTWMDARVGEWVVTPRTGKPVEINALWHGALAVMAALAGRLGRHEEAALWRGRADAVAQAFRRRFWNEQAGFLYDVIDGPDGVPPDSSLRPNQLVACALPHGLLETGRRRQVVDACAARLLTSFGLRSLAPGEPGYTPRFAGGPAERDAAYHQGTVWAWLIGPFVRAHLAAHDDPRTARSFLAPLEQQLASGCIGQLGEVFDAEPPHHPGGCFAQAWSVAEVIAAWAATRAPREPPPPAAGAKP